MGLTNRYDHALTLMSTTFYTQLKLKRMRFPTPTNSRLCVAGAASTSFSECPIPVSDRQIHFKIELDSISTKRHLLQQLASIHDPLGLIAPVVITIRILMQDSWRMNQQWDDPSPDQITQVWKRIRYEMSSVFSLSIPRCTSAETNSELDPSVKRRHQRWSMDECNRLR